MAVRQGALTRLDLLQRIWTYHTRVSVWKSLTAVHQGALTCQPKSLIGDCASHSIGTLPASSLHSRYVTLHRLKVLAVVSVCCQHVVPCKHHYFFVIRHAP